MKNLNFYRNYNKYMNGVSVVIFTKNSYSDLKELLFQINTENFNELIISDENSNDDTLKLAKKFTRKIIKSKYLLGKRRLLEAFKKCDYKFVICIETDHRIKKKGVFNELRKSLVNSNIYFAYAKLEYYKPNNFFSKAMADHYSMLSYKNYIGAPYITYTDFIKDIYNMRYISEGAGNDSALIDIFLKKKIKTKIIKEKLFQKENLNFNSFFKKFYWYGKGDYSFYFNNHKIWNFKRKIKSLTHVASNYFFIFPLLSLRQKKFNYILFLFLAGLIRYAGFMSKFLFK